MKPINLAKCKIGQRVKLRNGEIKTIDKFDKAASLYTVRTNDQCWYCNNGACYAGSVNAHDIIAILPLPKKKAKAPKTDEHYVKITKFQIRTLINVLQGFL